MRASARALPTALASPPATDTCAPMRTSEQVEQEADLAVAPGLLAGFGALVDDPAADLHDWYGRYLYVAPDELEPLDPATGPALREENRS